MSSKLFFQQAKEDVVATLEVDPAKGLSAKDIAERGAHYGPNSLPEGHKKSPIILFLSQFKDILIFVLIIAATISLVLGLVEEHGSLTEALLIYAIVIAIAVVGFFNEYKAEKTVEALRKLMSQSCRVRRDGQTMDIAVEDLVPGDIVLLDEGKKIPADLRLLVANRLQAIEASLTGESVPVSKHTDALDSDLALADQRNMLFSGTLIATGTAEGIVVATGGNTEIGKIAEMVTEVEDEATPMQKKLDDLGKKLGLAILAICAVVFVVILFLDTELQAVQLTQRLLLAFTAAVALAVAAIPEGLAFVVRISLALGARRMAAKKALVRKLSAVESLGSTDVICSDKTGTLTKGEMTVRNLFVNSQVFELTGSGYEPEGELRIKGKKVEDTNDDVRQLLEIGALCNNAHIKDKVVLGDPTEGSLIVSAAKLGLKHDDLVSNNPRSHEIPFSSERKMMSTVHKRKNDNLIAVKGAPGTVLSNCTKILAGGKVRALTKEDKELILNTESIMAGEALRVLGFAYKEVSSIPHNEADLEKELIFVGLQGMMDPPRTEVKEVIERVQTEAGMRVIMITGDNIETAKAVAKEIGITGEAMSGLELDKLDDEQFKNQVENIGIYARVNPEHKIRIVQALKHHGHQVAMTGDGVNDAPAIKAADIGIAMGVTGTDAAKEASDMILLDDKFLTIITAIEEGRAIFDNVRKFVNFLLSCNIAEVITVLFGLLIHGNLVLTAAQLLFINIVTDGLPAVALGSDPASKGVMKFKPSRYQEPIVTRRIWAEIVMFGVIMSAVLLAQYAFNLGREGAVFATSAAFMGMVIYEFVRLADIRSSYGTPWFSNPMLMISIGVSLLLQFAVLYVPPLAALFNVTPISGLDWGIMAIGAIVLFFAMRFLDPIEKLFDKKRPAAAPAG
jgi:Ca2+-transporting ATPase